MLEQSSLSRTGCRRILLVDDHPVIRQGLRHLIGGQPGLEVCGEADSHLGALRTMEQSRPDVAVIGLKLGDSSSFDLIKDARERFPGVLILVLSDYKESFYAERLLRSGVMGYISKEEPCQAILAAIRRVLSGGVYLSGALTDGIINKLVAARTGSGTFSVEHLTNREMQVFELLGLGVATRQVASQLGLSIKTVETHRAKIKKKLKISSSAELIRQAIQWAQCFKSDKPQADTDHGGGPASSKRPIMVPRRRR